MVQYKYITIENIINIINKKMSPILISNVYIDISIDEYKEYIKNNGIIRKDDRMITFNDLVEKHGNQFIEKIMISNCK